MNKGWLARNHCTYEKKVFTLQQFFRYPEMPLYFPLTKNTPIYSIRIPDDK